MLYQYDHRHHDNTKSFVPGARSSLMISTRQASNRGSRVPEPLLVFDSECPLNVQIFQELGPFSRLNFGNWPQHLEHETLGEGGSRVEAPACGALADVATLVSRRDSTLCPISLLRLSLLRFVDSEFPGNSLWTWEFHPWNQDSAWVEPSDVQNLSTEVVGMIVKTRTWTSTSRDSEHMFLP